MNILMIEDNESVAEMMSMFFEQQKGWEATFIQDGEEGWQYYLANEAAIEMIILDLNLPGKDGIQICRDIRKQNKLVPIIMLTARDAESEQVLGLGLGADDYVTKPFDPITFMARMRALYRRSQLTEEIAKDGEVENASQYDIETKFIRINSQNREAFFEDQLIEHLTPKEFEILQLLASHPKQVFTREHLLTTLWEDPFYGDERTVDAHIKKLRQKMEEYGPQLIQTVWGVGYKFDETGV
ncbi:response regulator transcription factor [Aerococcus sp. 1KP-2016]|jgi:DNA-binding response OmpR family regulator|uniref:response regulator transcription factor n=1 Tax=Aerococcus sp. 1KP-2016 TaxID=1981982 RepID=UPI000B99BE14|nr:response regulator transcription factor [Aerococcus sp. 1KP-2016]OYQ67514.1 DNA-binding response regulator [Aerococcus sp. 1KP-2016]